MKSIGFATLISGGLAAAVLGFAAPAQAVTPCDGLRVLDLVAETRTGIDHLDCLDDIKPKAKVPMVDTSVRRGR